MSRARPKRATPASPAEGFLKFFLACAAPPPHDGGGVTCVAASDSDADGAADAADAAPAAPAAQRPAERPAASQCEALGLLESFAFDGAPAEVRAAPRPVPGLRGRRAPAAGARLAARPAGAPRLEEPSVAPARRRPGKTGREDFSALPEAERERIRAKWWGFAGAGAAQDRRFQLVAAAVLHAKATEQAVRRGLEALAALGVKAEAGPRVLTAELLASVPVEAVEVALEGVHWHKAKAGRLVAAARAVRGPWRGHVPCQEAELLKLPGIGPRLAAVLAFVFAGADEGDGEGRPEAGAAGGVT